MKIFMKIRRWRFAIAFISLLFLSCASGYLGTRSAGEAEVSGLFNIVLYRSPHLDGIEALAILDIEGDAYEFVPAAPKFEYEILNGVSADHAIAKAKAFVSEHRAFHSLRISAIVDGAGGVIGYEVRPLYMPFEYGQSDVMDVGYRLKEGGKVRVRVYIKDDIRRMIDDNGKGGGMFRFRSGGGL